MEDTEMSRGYEPLSIQERMFLALERPCMPMHVTATCVFDGRALTMPDGRLDVFRIRRHFASSLTTFRRYRQRLARVPLDGTPVWVDDERFDLDYHLRYVQLSARNNVDDRGLKELCGRIMASELDRTRPLWEAWVVEGLEDGRFALVTKVHHALADGVAGVDLIASLLAPESAAEPVWPDPVRMPGALEMLRHEMTRRATARWAALDAWRPALTDPSASLQRLAYGTKALWDTLGAGLKRAPATPLNMPIGPRRRFEWLTMDLRQVKEVRARLSGTINDVVLSTVAGAMRRFLESRGSNVDSVRALVPVNMRTPSRPREMGNHVTAWLVDLPVQERDAFRCFSSIRRRTEPLRQTTRALEGEALTTAGMWALQFAGSLLGTLRPFNLVVTNVPGPAAPLDLLGSRLEQAYPQVPLFAGQGLGIALFSYVDKLCWGFNADPDLVPDLSEMPAHVSAAFEELRLGAELLHHARCRDEDAPPAHLRDVSTGAAQRLVRDASRLYVVAP